MMKSVLLTIVKHSNISHSTTSLARRALLLISFLLLGLGNVWGQEFNMKGTMESGGIVKDVYLDVLDEHGCTITIAQDDIIKELNSLGSSWTSDNIADNLYIRWSVLDGNDNYAENFVQNNNSPDYGNISFFYSWNNVGILWSTDVAGFCWFKDYDKWNADAPILNIETYVNSNDSFASFSDYTVVCYVSDDLTGTTPYPNDYTLGSLEKEPNFKLKYVFHFGAKVDDFTNEPNPAGCTTGSKSREIDANTTSISIDLSEALAKTSNVDYKYIRIYLENNGKVDDPDGKLMVSYKGTSLTLGSEFKERGYWQYEKDGSLQASDFEVTLNVPEGEFENYQVVCVLAKDVDDSWEAKEPYWDLQFTYAFEYSFKGQVTDETIKMEETFEVPVSKQSGMFRLSIEYSDNSDNLIKLYYLDQWENTTEVARTSINSQFLSAFPDATVPNDFYIRWSLRKEGEEIYIPTSLANPKNGVYENLAKDRYYCWSTTSGGQGKSLNDILKINFNGAVLSKLTDYELVFTIATDLEGAIYDSGNLTHEPNTMAYEYAFHFIDKPFEATTIENVKSKIAIYDPSTGKVSPDLFTDYTATMADLGTDVSNFIQKGYLRWYVIDTEGNMVDITLENTEWQFTAELEYTNNAYGYYIEPTSWDSSNPTTLNPTFILPADIRENYKQYQIVCVMTISEWGNESSLPDYESPTMKIKYVFSLMTEDEIEELQKFSFVHYKGYSGRDWVKPEGSKGEMMQQIWDDATGEAIEIAADVRQGVHTYEYNIYILPNIDEYLLDLPFQNYRGEGQNLEPRAYIRWYDWNTDKKVRDDDTFTLNKKGTFLKDEERGLFYIYQNEVNLCHSNIGVTFTPKENFSESIDIACDVSKYSDGMIEVGGTYHLLHEPTLSNRYIFHIYPAKDLADRLKKAKLDLEGVLGTAKGDISKKQDLYDAMSALEEDKGKVVVSIADDNTQFALRFDFQRISDYVVYNGDDIKAAGNVKWYAYYEESNRIEEKDITDKAIIGSDGNVRIGTFTYGDFKKNGDGKKCHVVGYISENSYSEDFFPVVHYELHFIEAAPIKLKSLIDNPNDEDNKMRTEAYMKYYYDLAGVVDFDGNPKTNPDVIGNEAQYYSTPNWYDAPTSSTDNLTYVPFPWDHIQYGFCYPELTPTIKNGLVTGVAPEHGDYIVVKSMNWDGISSQMNTPPYNYYWWWKSELHDYTYYSTKEKQHGSFLYTDASDESRTIATIPFTANLCSGSSIYFTAVVANMTFTTGHVAPQLLIRIVGIDNEGNRQRIVAFHTGELSAGSEENPKVQMGEWYQVYGASTLTNFDPNITHFEAEVINYANGTEGADFAFDQLMIYTSTAKVLLTQTSSSDCEDDKADEENKVQVYMAAEGLQNEFGVSDEPQPIYWRICEEGTDKVITGTGMYPQYDEEGNLTSSDENGTNTYGITYVITNFSEDDVDENISETFGWYKTKDDEYFFQLANKGFSALEEGKNYYVSVYKPTDIPFTESNAASWGSAKDICSIYSEFFIPHRQYVTYIVPESDGEEGGEITIPCGSSGAEVSGVVMVLKVPDDTQISGFRDEKISFDYILCSKNEWNSDTDLGNGIKYGDLIAALEDYRQSYPEEKGLATEYQDETYRETLEKAIAAKILILAASPEFTYTFSEAGTHYVTCIPISKKIDNTETEICGPFEVIFKLKSSGGPSLTLGFEGVDYTNKGIRVVRVGLEQLNNMKSNYLLHIPVHSYKTDADAKEKEGTVLIDGNLEMLQYQEAAEQTNDKDWNENIDVATFANDKINKDNMYISVNFNGITNPAMPTFKEGFTYRMFFLVKNEGAEDGACEGKVEFLMKVVPEYVTWNDNGTVTPNDNKNTNWNNDANWSRSKKEELHKTSGYQNNGTEVGDNGVTSTPATFVPMKFTYVTIPSDNVAPNLIELETGTTIGTDDGIYTNIGEGATPNIQYDMMVKVEDECSHGISGNVYDCETFYGNWAKEIYFKPRAELVNQQYLTYEKVWVEKELTANTWTLMSTPLQNTYAGDMYVPISGRQETEAFTDINFGEGYSRTLYPIYQKSWKQEGSKVYTMTNDVRATEYEAGLKGGVTSTLSLWSHVYNDVQEPYSQWKGFAIRAHKKEQNDKALLRLPKEDPSYNYYDWNGTVPEENNVMQTVGKPTTGKLFTDNTENIIGLTYGVKYSTHGRTAGEGNVEILIGEVQSNNNYLLIGNPYLCSIDMAKFLEANNSILESKYWTYEYNKVESPYTKGTIKPLQSFFVKLQDGVINGDEKITFTSAMMVDGNTRSIEPSAVSAMTMTAANKRGQSTATLSVGEETKSVETLFDSNLEEVPMIYTVANGQAVSIQQLTDLDKPIAFGVACAASDELVEVTFSDIAQLTEGDLFVLDAVTGEQTKVGEGDGYSVQPNDYGRYFLLAGATNISDKVDVQKGIMVSVRGKEVTVTSGEELTLVHALSLTGATVYQDAARSTTASFSLPSGVYFIKVENVAGEQQTVKVIVK